MITNPDINIDDPILSLIQNATNGGYRVFSRVPDSVELSEHPEYGIAATTGNGEIAQNLFTGPCLISPFDSNALKKGYNPLTYNPDEDSGIELKSYDQFKNNFLYNGAIPRASQILDHWGITNKKEGKVILLLEDEEWTNKICSFLEENSIKVDEEKVFGDVHNIYKEYLFETFRIYVNGILDNDLDIIPMFTSDYSDQIDALLDESTKEDLVHSTFAETNRYVQRIHMYTTPIWLNFIENEFGLEIGSTDISDPIRYYDEFFNYKGSGNNIFRDLQVNYYSKSSSKRKHEIHIVPPVLAPFRKGFSFERKTIPHKDVILPNGLDEKLAMLDPQSCMDTPNLLEMPLPRFLSGFPNLADRAIDIMNIWKSEKEKRPIWKKEAKLSVVNHEISDDVVQRENGIKIQDFIQTKRNEKRGLTSNSEAELIIETHQDVSRMVRQLMQNK